MGGVREHVYHPGGHAAVTGQVHQQPGIAGQRGGVAADVHNALRRLPGFMASGQSHGIGGTAAGLVNVGQGFAQGKRAFARGIDQPFVGVAIGHEQLRGHVEQIASYKFSSCKRLIIKSFSIIKAVILFRACDQRFTSFNPQHLPGLGGNRQSEVAQAAEPVNHAVGFLRPQ